MSLNIFISHAWADKAQAAYKRVERKLGEGGYELWVDKQAVEYGEKFETKMDEGIAWADVVILLWSKNAHSSKNVRHEIETALRLGKPLIPCKISDYDVDEYEPLRGRKYVPFDMDFEYGLLQMNQALMRLLVKKKSALSGNAEIQRDMEALNRSLNEMEDMAYRSSKKVSGNEASSAYIDSALEMGKLLVSTSSNPQEKARMRTFLDLVQEIARRHPDTNEDDIKKRKLAAAIDQADPNGESPMLQSFKQALVQILGPALGGGGDASTGRSGDDFTVGFARQSDDDVGDDVEEDVEDGVGDAGVAPPPSRSPLHQHIAAVRREPGARTALRQRLKQLLAGSGSSASLPEIEKLIDQGIDTAPDVLEALAQAAHRSGLAQQIVPILQIAQEYFFEPKDLVLDSYGILGLVDDAYLVHAFLLEINESYRQSTGVRLVDYDPTPILQLLAAVLEPQVTQQLHQSVAVSIQQVVQASYYQQLSQQRASIDMNDPTGGPGAWGNTFESEMARMAAKLGVSFNL